MRQVRRFVTMAVMDKPLKEMTPEELKAYNRERSRRSYARRQQGLAPLRRRGADSRASKSNAADTSPRALIRYAGRAPLGVVQRFDAAQAALSAQHPDEPLQWDKTALFTKALEKFTRDLEKKYNGGKPFTSKD